MKTVKRISPTTSTLRELYILSGNKCAFPQCTHEIIDENGTFVAELCHIEAAMPGGERFNPNMTNEERAHSSNLLFLCHKHHKVTDNVKDFDVEKLKKIKFQHENLFRNIMSDMLKTIEDTTKKQILINSKSFNKINKTLQWELDGHYLEETVNSYNKKFETLKKLDRNSRSVFTTIIDNSEMSKLNRIVLLSSVQKSLRLTSQEMNDFIDILMKHDFISEPYTDDCYTGFISQIKDPEGWDVWGEIKKFCEIEGISLQEIILELDFEKLD